MDRGSDKHGSRMDEHQKQETEGLVRGGGTSHAEEWKEPEPMPAVGEENPIHRPPDHEPGTAEGISAEGVERRSDLAKWLSDADWPTDRRSLLAHAEQSGAPDLVLTSVRRLPGDTRFANIAEVAKSLGLGIEEKRW